MEQKNINKHLFSLASPLWLATHKMNALARIMSTAELAHQLFPQERIWYISYGVSVHAAMGLIYIYIYIGVRTYQRLQRFQTLVATDACIHRLES